MKTRKKMQKHQFSMINTVDYKSENLLEIGKSKFSTHFSLTLASQNRHFTRVVKDFK